MKIFVVGGTGFIGHNIIEKSVAQKNQVIALTRSAQKGKKVLGDKVTIVEGDPNESGPWQELVDGCNAVIIMSGEPIVGKRWTQERKQLLLDSRLKPTVNVVEAIRKAKNKPKTLLCGSAIGFYGNTDDRVVTEESSGGNDFSADLCRKWEEEANKAKELGVRVVNLRTSFVLAKKGGALGQLMKPFQFYLGGHIGSGDQYMSWIHISDYIALALLALNNEKIEGPLNMSSPNPVTNKEFTKTLGKAMGRPNWLPVPAFVLRLMLGEAATLAIEGQRVIPQKALDHGYKFRFEILESALNDVV